MANDIDIIVGVKDLATSVLDRLSSKVNSFGDNSKLAFAGAAERLSDQLAKVGSSAGSVGSSGNDKLVKAIESAVNGLSTKLDVALAKTNSAIDSVTNRIQSAINTTSQFITKIAAIASTAAAFVTVGRAINAVPTALASVVVGYNGVENASVKAKQGILSSLAPYTKYVVAAGATTTLAKATIQATSATSGLVSKVTALGRGALAAFVLANAMKKTEDGATTLAAKIAKVAGVALAFDVAARATLRFGLSLIGLGKKSDDATNALIKTANASNGIVAATARVTAIPFKAMQTGATSAAVATTNLASKIDELPKGAQSINTLVAGFGTFASQIGGIPGLLLAIPAGIAGLAFAAVTAAGQTDRQLTQLTNKLAIVEAAKLNISIDAIDTAPLRKVAEDTATIAKQIQTATNVQSSKLISLGTSALAKGLGADQIGESLKAAVGLSEVYGTSIEDGMYRARQAIEGNFESFEKLIPSIKTMKNDSDKLAAVSRLAANGFKVMASESLTFWGTIEKVKNGFGNTLESMGRFKSLSDVVGTILRDVVTPAVEFLDTKLKGFGFDGGKVLEQATSIGAGVVAAIETIGSNWDSILDRMAIGSELFWVQLTSHVENFVNTTLPWLAENFTGIFQHAWATVANNSKSQFEYMVTSAMESMGAVPKGTADFQKAENDKKPKYKPAPLTEIGSRSISPREQEIQGRLDAVDSKLGSSFNDNFKKAFESIDAMVKDQKKAFEINLAPKAGAEQQKLPDAIDKQSKNTANASAALESRFLARGSSNDLQKEMSATLKRHEALLQKQLSSLEKKSIKPASLEVELVQ